MISVVIVGVFAWCAIWIGLAAKFQAACTPTRGGGWLAAFAGSSCLIIFVGLPLAGSEPGALTLWIHHAAIFGLGVFLLVAEFLRAAIRRYERRGEVEQVASALHMLWWLTELVPGAVAITVMGSGLRLIYEGHGMFSARAGWLFWLLVAFGFFFADGLGFYLPYVRGRNRNPQRGGRRSAEVQLTLHALSYPVVFTLAAARLRLPSPLHGAIVSAETALPRLPPGASQTIVAAIVLGTAILVVRSVRTLSTRIARA